MQVIQLVGQDGAAVKQQAADERALAVVHAAGGQEAQRAVRVWHGGSNWGGDSLQCG
jgi:hypothetical protein